MIQLLATHWRRFCQLLTKSVRRSDMRSVKGPGRPGRLLSLGSHRSGLADFPHPARHVVVPALNRFRRSDGDTLTRCDALAWFQTSSPQHGVPFSPRGPGGPVPPLRRYYGTLRLPTVPLAALRCLRWAIPPSASWICSRRLKEKSGVSSSFWEKSGVSSSF